MNSVNDSANRSVEITIELAAVRHNFAIAKTLAKNQKLFAVVKADAYGHGAMQVANALPDADGFAVVTVGEALRLRKGGIAQPIFVLQGAQNENDLSIIAKHKLWCAVHDYHQLRFISDHPKLSQVPLWLKLDTGMGRLGFSPDDVASVQGNFPNVQWAGAFTHFSCADEPESTHTPLQIALFESARATLGVQGSMANSAGLLAWPESSADWARPGLMLYGCSPMDQKGKNSHAKSLGLKPAMSVRAPIIAMKHVKKGCSIGYARKHICAVDSLIAYVGVGYGDGLPRILDSTAKIMVDSQPCSVVGRVSMDSIALDVSAVSAVKVGDRALLWGQPHPVEQLAYAAGTLSYELLTTIRGSRVYTN